MAEFIQFPAIGFSVKIVHGREGLYSLKDEWLEVTNSLRNKRFYHLYQWYKSYLESIGKEDNSIYFILLYKNKILQVIFPLRICKKRISSFKFDVLEIPYHPHINLSDFIMRDEVDVQEVIDILKKSLDKFGIRWDFIYLPHVLEDSSMVRYGKRFFFLFEYAGKCDYLQCNSYDEIQKKFSKNFRRNLTKARNKLFEKNNVNLISTRQDGELFGSFEEFIEVEASGWKGERGSKTAIKLDPKVTMFYKCLIKNYSEINGCEINLLKINNETIAGQFCLLVDGTKYVLKIGYNESYSNFSPGNILLENLIQRACKDRCTKYINLVTDSKWHSDWKTSSYGVFRIYIFNKTIKGLIAFILIKTKQFLRPIYRRYFCKFVYSPKDMHNH